MGKKSARTEARAGCKLGGKEQQNGAIVVVCLQLDVRRVLVVLTDAALRFGLASRRWRVEGTEGILVHL